MRFSIPFRIVDTNALPPAPPRRLFDKPVVHDFMLGWVYVLHGRHIRVGVAHALRIPGDPPLSEWSDRDQAAAAELLVEADDRYRALLRERLEKWAKNPWPDLLSLPVVRAPKQSLREVLVGDTESPSLQHGTET